MTSILDQMIHTWANGGWVMAAMALLALIMYATAVHLLWATPCRGLKRAGDVEVQRWVEDPRHAPTQVRELIRYTQDEVRSLRDVEGRFREVETTEVSDLDRRLAFLKVLVVAAPLLGLLGTVLGMLLTFKAIGVGGSSTSEIIAKGISEALVATQTGMMVAIPGLLMAHVVKRMRDEYVAFLARLEGTTLRYFRAVFHGMTQTIRRPELPVRSSAESQPATVAA